MSYLTFSKTWAGYLSEKAGFSSDKEVILTYIIEVLVLNLINIILTLLLGLLLGVLPGTASCLLMIALFRHTAGGAHSNSPWRCAIITILVFPLIALLAAVFSPVTHVYADIFSAVTIFIGMVTIALLAPVDSSSAPIISPLRRKKLKTLSLIVMLFATAVIFWLRQSTWAHASEIRLSLVFGVLWVCLMLSKPGHKIISYIDSLYVKKGGAENEENSC